MGSIGSLSGICYAQGLFVAGGSQGLYYSTNAQVWVQPSQMQTVVISAIVHAGNRFWAAGSDAFAGGGAILSSPDGKSWSRFPGIDAPVLSGFVSGPQGLLAIGAAGTILNGESKGTATYFQPWGSRFVRGGSFVFVIDSPPDAPVTLEYSSDLVHWLGLEVVTNSLTTSEIIDPAVGQTQRFYRARAD